MNWLIHRTYLTKDLEEYFTFNEIPLTDATFSESSSSKDSVFIIDPSQMAGLVVNSPASIVDFVQRGNRVWIWGDHDVLFFLNYLQEEIQLLDSKTLPGQILIFNDAPPVESHWFNSLQNIQIDTIPIPWCTAVLPVRGGLVEKVSASRDYMLTMVNKPDRPHRALVWNEMLARTGLLDRGHAVCHSGVSDARGQYQGQKSFNSPWHQFYHFAPSMDLYLDSWFEIVPETFCQDAYLLTEKTVKAISTKTPFLAVSTPGYLKYLHQLGFQTFGNIIDESYDDIIDLDNRITAIIDLTENIINKGSESFYRECYYVLEHNHAQLAYLAGMRKYQLGRLVSQHISALDR